MGAPLVAGRVLLWDDQMSLARRDDAPAMLLAPAAAYASCADAAQWQHAVRAGGSEPPHEWSIAKCRESGDVPCSAMALITVFGGATSWRGLPLKSKHWLRATALHEPDASSEGGRGGGAVPDDFCLKRRRFTNETRAGENGRSVDELGMAC